MYIQYPYFAPYLLTCTHNKEAKNSKTVKRYQMYWEFFNRNEFVPEKFQDNYTENDYRVLLMIGHNGRRALCLSNLIEDSNYFYSKRNFKNGKNHETRVFLSGHELDQGDRVK